MMSMRLWCFLAQAIHLRAPRQWIRPRCSGTPQHGQEFRCNLIYVKIFKTGSSTAGGVARRIAAHNGLHGVHSSSWGSVEPFVAANHASMYELFPRIEQLHLPSFLFTMVREPAARCLSHFYHGQVDQRGEANIAENKIAYLRACKNLQVDYMSWHFSREFLNGCSGQGPVGPRDVSGVLAFYDFVGVTDDFDTSMAVLAERLQVPRADVLFLSSKVSGEHGMTPHPHPPLHEEPASVQAFVRDEFRQDNYDYDLWNATKRRLYEQAESVDVAAFKHELSLATRACEGSKFPAAFERGNGREDGRASGCYWSDNGCGYQCLDSFTATFSSNSSSH